MSDTKELQRTSEQEPVLTMPLSVESVQSLGRNTHAHSRWGVLSHLCQECPILGVYLTSWYTASQNEKSCYT